MTQAELVLGALTIAVIASSAFASRLGVPYPVLMVITGVAVGFVPGLPHLVVTPGLILVLLVPPLLYKSALFANYADFRHSLRSLTLSTIPLVVATMTAVACTAHTVADGMTWPMAFVLGAVVAPTDPVAASAILRGLHAPRQLVSAIEGEGLFNDTTALVAYRVALTAVVSGTFSLADAGMQFLTGISGGVAIGLAVGWASTRLRAHVANPEASITLSLLTGYAAFVPADALGTSGVVAAVTAGLYGAIRGANAAAVQPRLQGSFVWELVDFLVNAALFVIIGLQLHTVIAGLASYAPLQVAGDAVAVVAVVIASRVAWFFTVPYFIRLLDRRATQKERRVPASWRLVMAWSGMRGAVSLAVGLSIPVSAAGGPFPQRDLILFLICTVIVATFVLQGVTLPAVVRWAHLDDNGASAREETHARIAATRAALDRVDTLAEQDWADADTVARMRDLYHFREQRLLADAPAASDDPVEERTRAYQRLTRAVIDAQRQTLLNLRTSDQLSNDTWHQLQRELDLDETRLDDS